MIVLELGLEAGRIYHVRRRAESRNNVGVEETIIFHLEVLWVGRPFEEGSQRVACGCIPECKTAFWAMGRLGWVRDDCSSTE